MNSDSRFSIIRAAIILIVIACHRVGAQDPTPDHERKMKAGTALFRESIRALLVERCWQCHGGEKVRAELDLSSRKRLIESGTVDLEDPGSSYLLDLIRHAEEPHMPPTGEQLTDAQVEAIERWLTLGAPYDKPLIEKNTQESTAMQVTESDRQFWSFRDLSKVQPPVDASDWAQTNIDRFVVAKLAASGLKPNPPADDRSRVRRTYLDLIGLPPTPEQMDSALQVSHEALVNELLDNPHYGERWARHWLDAARFAESHGFEQDYDRKYAYHYRDFVIKAFNADMPWDQFVRWQIAGDELAPDDPLAMMATGFLGAGVFPTQLTEKEFESARYDELDDMAATIGTAMLGLTIGCARCHDHKFDPIPTADYYRFVSTFTTTIRSEIDVQIDKEVHAAELAEWRVAHDEVVAARDAYRRSADFEQRATQWIEEDALSAVGKSLWTVLDVTKATSSRPSTKLTPQSDASILASGNAPQKETYTVHSTIKSGPIRSIRIEALTDSSMKRQGPGRASNGNFALSDLKLFVIDASAKPGRTPIKLDSAIATHEQNTSNLSVASAIDDDPSGTGWAVDFGGIGKPQAAVFRLATPLVANEEQTLEFQLRFSNNAQHSLGRFRLSFSASADPPVRVGDGLPKTTREALAALEQGEITGEQRATLIEIFAKADPEWIKLDQAVQISLVKQPQPQMVKVQVSSEGFPPTRHHADGRGFPHFYPETHYLNRGDPNQKQGVAESGFLQVLMRSGKSSSDWQQTPPPTWNRTSYRRTGMAAWITDPHHGAGHLLARVAANRIWHHHFGRGIVATPNDFGLQGAPPTHPALLDYLANRLIENGWSIKSLHREILLSATWLQSSENSSTKSGLDPENQWLWRFPTRRLEAEVVRDSMLAAAGLLDRRQFGPGTLNADHRRRSIYFMIKRSRLVPMMQVFDQPEPLSSQGSRPSTTIAPQALLVMNNAQVVQWASAFADRFTSEDTETAIRNVYAHALGREPNDWELEESELFVQQQAESYQESSELTSDKCRQLALADLCHITFGLNEFVYLP